MKEAVKLHMVCISSNNDRQLVHETFTPLHYTCRNFTSSLSNISHLHFTTLSFGLTPYKFPTAPFHLTSPHFTSLHFTSLQFQTISATLLFLLFRPTYNYFPNSLSKILGLQGKVPNASVGSWFQFLMVLFTEEYFPLSVLCFLSPFFPT